MNQNNNNLDTIHKHLDPHQWEIVNKKQLKKAISEFAHEKLIKPKLIDKANKLYIVYADDSNIYYEFKAQILKLEHWWIDENSISKIHCGQKVAVDLITFILEFKNQLNLSDNVLPTYLEELTSTLFSQAYKTTYHSHNAKELVKCNFQQIEQAMIEGHPCFLANSGRIGFSGLDYKAYAPEAVQPFSIIWLAGDSSNTCFSSIKSLSYKQLLEQELSPLAILTFNQKLVSLGKKPDNFIFIPVHPWQWVNKLTLIFAPDIATKKLIYLGKSQDEYLAQQSIRTLYNIDQPTKFYTKTSLSIVNMGFMRGLSPNYMRSTPTITEWINDLLEPDLYLQECGFIMLGEVATVGYTNPYYKSQKAASDYHKMLSALWRESPIKKKKAHQKVMTMAAFLHVDQDGQAFLPELIQASGLSIENWLTAYFKSYLSPLLHCFFKYELVFMPHGENVIMILENNLPVGIFMKDITEEILVYNQTINLPKEVQRVFVDTTDEMKVLSLFTDVFDCYFRFMSALLHKQSNFSQNKFWELVATSILDYQRKHPEFTDKYKQYDLFVSEFKKCCLNRLQLNNNKQMLDLTDPVNSLQFSGMLKNPIAIYKEALILNPA